MIPPNIPQVSLTAIRSAAFSFIALAMILITASTSRAMDMVDMLAMGVTWDIEAVADGDWDDGATWSGGQTPQTGDNVLIPSGFTVTLTHQDTAVLDRILVQGTLSIQNGNTRLTVDTLLVDNSPRGALHIGSPSSGIGHDKLAEIIIAASATVPLTGGEMGRGVISQGEVRMYSDTRDTKGFLQGDALAGATQLTMASAPSGWQVGDMIVVPQTSYSWNKVLENEPRVITALSGATVTLDEPLLYDHIRAETGAEFQIAVANLTRPIVIRSADGVGQFSKDRGHIMFGPDSDVFIDGLQCKDLGRTDKTKITSATNPEARYSLHFHRNGYDTTQTVTRSVAWNTPGWGFVNHSSSVIFDDNAVYDFYGAGFSAEAGDELGSFTNNIAIGGIGDGRVLLSTRSYLVDTANIARTQLGDMGFLGEGFWLQSPQITVTDNITAGGNGPGMSWWTTGKREGDFITGLPVSRVPASAGTPREWIEPSQFTGETMAVSQDIPILICDDNTAYGCYQGLKSRYVNAWFNSGYDDMVATTVAAEMFPTLRDDSEYGPTTINRFTSWNCLWGAHLTYGRNFTVNDFLGVNSASSGQGKGYIGLHSVKGQTDDSLTTDNARVRYFRVGFEAHTGQEHTARTIQESDSDYLEISVGSDSQINANSWFKQGTPVPVQPMGYRMVIYDDFEGGMGNWIDGGSDCLHKKNSAAPQGGGSVKLRDDTASAIMTTGDLDLSLDSRAYVSFKYRPSAMESNDSFSLEISTDGGVNFSTVQTWTGLVNNLIVSESVFIDGVTLTSQTQFRFRCLGNVRNDNVFIDAVLVSAK
ncbi:MAG: hypothetical protein HRU46_18280 [Verrucomicrobiales bacterium]|nr:hypothetical protein [Verrucomicrobiales bacterium]